MKDRLDDFVDDTKAMAANNPWKTAAIIAVSFGVGYLLGAW